MDIKYIGEQALSYLINKCKETFASLTHTHTPEEIGADVAGSASAALAISEAYTDEQVALVATAVAYIDETDNETVVLSVDLDTLSSLVGGDV